MNPRLFAPLDRLVVHMPCGARGSVRSLMLSASLVLAACTNTPNIGYEPPQFATTRQSDALQSLPAPTDKLTVAVYSFADQTGQRRRNEKLAELSSAVTQGGASIVVNALKELGGGRWFSVLEREGVENLLKERQIIRSTREQYGDRSALPPLLFAGVLIEGGIISYESNMSQGGLGARLVGIGGSTEWRRDQVTVALRAVSVQTGEVVVALTTTKTVFSAQISANVFRYVAEDKIFELDAGAATNEPMQVAVREAIEHAVLQFAGRGANTNLFRFANPADRDRVLAAIAKPGSNPTATRQVSPAAADASSPPAGSAPAPAEARSN